jgi:SAM-dependent methyltransferase
MESPELGTRLRREKEFHDQWAAGADPDSLDPERVATCPTTPETLHALELLGDVAGKELLEIGTGYGELTSWLAARGARVTTRDVSPGMVELARRVARRRGLEESIRFEVGPGEMLPHEDGSFDLVFGHDVLHHMDLPRAAGEIRRVLRGGGRAVFAEPLGHNPVLNHYRDTSPETRTPDEQPLLFSDFETLRQGFSSLTHREFHLATMAIFLWFRWVERLDPNEVRYWKRIIDEAERYRAAFSVLNGIDRLIFAAFPPARRWGRMTVIHLRA